MPKLTPASSRARRDRILDAAERCFAREGFGHTTMQSVMNESGISAGGIYSHFNSKDEIVAAIAERRHMHDAELFNGPSDVAPLARLMDVARRFVNDLDKPEQIVTRQVAVQLWAEALRNDAIRDQLQAGVAAPADQIASLLRAAGAKVDAYVAARMLVALFHGIVLQRAWNVPVNPDRGLEVLRSILSGLVEDMGD